jgi:hypothetical protein
MVNILKNVAETFDDQSEAFYDQIPEVTADYNWQHRTNMVMDGLVNRLGDGMFTSSKRYLA